MGFGLTEVVGASDVPTDPVDVSTSSTSLDFVLAFVCTTVVSSVWLVEMVGVVATVSVLLVAVGLAVE